LTVGQTGPRHTAGPKPGRGKGVRTFVWTSGASKWGDSPRLRAETRWARPSGYRERSWEVVPADLHAFFSRKGEWYTIGIPLVSLCGAQLMVASWGDGCAQRPRWPQPSHGWWPRPGYACGASAGDTRAAAPHAGQPDHQRGLLHAADMHGYAGARPRRDIRTGERRAQQHDESCSSRDHRVNLERCSSTKPYPTGTAAHGCGKQDELPSCNRGAKGACSTSGKAAHAVTDKWSGRSRGCSMIVAIVGTMSG